MHVSRGIVRSNPSMLYWTSQKARVNRDVVETVSELAGLKNTCSSLFYLCSRSRCCPIAPEEEGSHLVGRAIK